MIKRLIYYTFFVFFLPGCMFYSFKGSLPAHIHSISLAPVVNESTEFAVAEILNNELNDIMVNENILNITTPNQADSQLEVIITSVMDSPYTVSLSDKLGGVEEVEEWRVTIKTSVTWYDLKRDEILLRKNMNSWGIYSPGVDISTDGLDNDGDCPGDTDGNGCICCAPNTGECKCGEGDQNVDAKDSDEVGSPRESAMNISVRLLMEDIVNEITNTW